MKIASFQAQLLVALTTRDPWLEIATVVVRQTGLKAALVVV